MVSTSFVAFSIAHATEGFPSAAGRIGAVFSIIASCLLDVTYNILLIPQAESGQSLLLNSAVGADAGYTALCYYASCILDSIATSNPQPKSFAAALT